MEIATEKDREMLRCTLSLIWPLEVQLHITYYKWHPKKFCSKPFLLNDTLSNICPKTK